MKKLQNIKRTNSIAEVIKESQQFLQIFKKRNKNQVQKVTKKIQKQNCFPKKQKNTQKKQQFKKKASKIVFSKEKQQKQNQSLQKQQYLNKQNYETQQQQQQTKQQQQLQQQNQNQNIYPKRRQFTEKELQQYINIEQLQEGVHQMDQNKNFKDRFLGREGAFSKFKILVGSFHNFFYNGGFDATAGQELKKRGFQYELERDFDKFVSKMINYDVVWLISTCVDRSQNQQNNLINQTGKFFKAKKSLYLWCENSPYHIDADIILKKYFNGMHMKGNYYGDKIITRGKLGKGKFDENHSIGFGLNNLHEGITICSPQNTHSDFKHFAYNSNNEPLVSYAEENEKHGRIIIDCGFTKLYKINWDKAGTAQYVSNSNVWLTGIPQ